MRNEIKSVVDKKFYLDQFSIDSNLNDLKASEHYHQVGFKKGKLPNSYFDFDYYKEQLDINNISFDSDFNFVKHYETKGWKLGLVPSVYFDQEYYKSKAGNIEGNPFLHYLNCNEENSPHPLLDFYWINKHSSLAHIDGAHILDKIAKLEDKFLKNEQMVQLKSSPFFDELWYGHEYKSENRPLYHYIRNVSNLKNNPNKFFLKNLYQKLNGFHADPLSDLILSIEKIKARKPTQPKVSIIILNWNRALTTIQCIDHLVKKTSKINELELIIVENGSNEGEFETLQRYCGHFCKIIQLDTNRYFGEANNIAVEQCLADKVLFLNNDAFPQRGWIDALDNLLESRQDAGCAGPMFYFPDDRIQEMGGIVSEGGQVVQIGKGLFDNDVTIPEVKEVDYSSAACMLMRKDLFLKIGGFDFTFEPAYFEDTDLCTKIRAAGKKVLWTSKTKVYHFENFTSKDPNIGFDFMPNIYKNRKKFVARWGKMLSENNLNGNLPRKINLEKEAIATNGKTAVVYSPYHLIPGGGERYILSVALTLAKEGYEVHFATPEVYSRIRLRNIAFDLRLDGLLINQINPIKYQEVSSLPKPDIFVCMGNEVLPSKPGIGHLNIYHCQFPFPLHDMNFMAKNHRFLGNYSTIIVNSEFTKKSLASQYSKLNLEHPTIKVLHPPVTINNEKVNYSFKTNSIVHVGRFISDGHNKRQDILIEAFIELYDKHRKSLPGLELNLIGASYAESRHQKYLSSLVKSAEGYPIYFHIDASPELLVEIYNKSKVYWHATGYEKSPYQQPHKMEHFGISVVEALSFGCTPIVYSKGGPSEIVQNDDRFLFDNIVDLVQKTDKHLKSNDVFEDLTRIANLYDDAQFQKTLVSLLN